MTTTDIERGERLHGLDALRGAALLLGVLVGGTILAIGVVAPMRRRLRRAEASGRLPRNED